MGYSQRKILVTRQRGLSWTHEDATVETLSKARRLVAQISFYRRLGGNEKSGRWETVPEVGSLFSSNGTTGFRRHRMLIEGMGDELRILTAVALCDGSLDVLEQEWISQIAKLLGQELGIEARDHEIDAVIDWATGRLRDRRAISDCIVRLAIKRPEVLAILGELCELVAEIDGKANISEEQTLHFIRDLISTKWNAH
jgi:tellurite resistance protein